MKLFKLMRNNKGGYKMRALLKCLIGCFILIFYTLDVLAQIDSCEYFVSGGKKIFSIFKDGDDMWIGTDVALVKYNTSSTEMTFFDELCDHPCVGISAIAKDSTGNLWFGTGSPPYGNGCGLIQFDGDQWVLFNSENSPLPDNTVQTLAVDSHNDLWIGCGV